VLGVPAPGRDTGRGGGNLEMVVLRKAIICHSKLRS
jgi:hypothetical protein